MADMRLSLIARVPCTASTNSLLAQLLAEGGELGGGLPTALLFADEQSAGRGRGGNVWASPRGGLYFSVLFPADPLPPHLPLTAGIYLARWLSRTAGCRIAVRWPNDLMRGDRKLAGILGESKAPGICILGVGVNVNTDVPATPDRAPVSLRECLGKEISLDGLRSAVEHFVGGDFIPFILDAANLRLWPDHSYFVPGQGLTCRSGDRVVEGTYRGINALGHLRVESGGRVLELASAEEVRPT
jgi:BirA family biotin operon repressor/biotin-[acetyl-CoA-carboxylase] ligase